MTTQSTFRLEELGALHTNIRVLFALILALTLSLLGYMGVRVFVLSERMTPLDFTSLCFFAAACLALCNVQLQCLRRLRCETRVNLETLTFVDPLTGVYNLRYLRQRLAEELQRAKRQQEPLSVVYLDFDKFKTVNDTLGHETGNTLLQRIAQGVRGAARGEDFVGRLGGDEFLLVLPQTGPDGALAAAGRLKTRLDSLPLIASSGRRIDVVTFSIGVASYPANAETEADLLRAADEAMYRAKGAGGNRIAT